MKKIKLMLLSLSILAVVAGVLAFTAKEGNLYCTADVLPDGTCPEKCPNLAQLTAPSTSSDLICTAPTIIGGIDPCHYSNGEAVDCGYKVAKTIE